MRASVRRERIEEVEFATLGGADRFNTDHIHSHLDDDPPDQLEAAYAARQAHQNRVGIQ